MYSVHLVFYLNHCKQMFCIYREKEINSILLRIQRHKNMLLSKPKHTTELEEQERKPFTSNSLTKGKPLLNRRTLQTSLIYTDARNKLEKWWEKQITCGKGHRVSTPCDSIAQKTWMQRVWVHLWRIFNQSQYNLIAAQRMRIFEIWFKPKFPTVLMQIISKSQNERG